MRAPKYQVGQVIKVTKRYKKGTSVLMDREHNMIVAGSIQNVYWDSVDCTQDKRGGWVYELQIGDNGFGSRPTYAVCENDPNTTLELL